MPNPTTPDEIARFAPVRDHVLADAGESRRALRGPALAWLLLALSFASAGAQEVRGVLLDADAGVPLEGDVFLMGAEGHLLRSVTTDAEGRFTLALPAPGSYRLGAERYGYLPAAPTFFTAGAGETVEVELRLSPAPLPLDTLRARVGRGPPLERGQQLIYGRLLDDDTGADIVNGTVHLVNRQGSDVRTVLTDDDGLFRLVSPRPGTYTLRGEGMGYRTAQSPELNLMLGDTIGLEFRLSTEAVLLAPIVVTASARRWTDRASLLGMEEFFERYQRWGRSGYGEYLTRDQLAEWEGRLMDIGHVLLMTAREVTDIDVRTGQIKMGMGLHDCVPTYFVNGAPWPFPPTFGPGELEAVEVYRQPTIPSEFQRGQWPCGVVAMWTRRSPGGRPLNRNLFTAGLVALAVLLLTVAR